jgi:hypothetical protein
MMTLPRPHKLIFSLVWLFAVPPAVRPVATQTGGFVLVKERTQLPRWNGSIPVSCAFATGTATISASNGRLSIDRAITYNSIDAKKGSETIHVEWQVDQPPDFLPLGQKLRITCHGSATPPGRLDERTEYFSVKANVYVQTPGWQPVQRELIDGVWADNPGDMEEALGYVAYYRQEYNDKFIGSGTMYSEGTLDPAFAYKPGQELRISFYFEDQPGSQLQWSDEDYRNSPMHGNPLAVYFYRYDGQAAGGGEGGEAGTGTTKPPARPGEKTAGKWAPCDRYEEALARVRCMEWHLQTLRQIRTELENARNTLLETMYGSDIIDIGFLAGGVWAGLLNNTIVCSTEAGLQAVRQGVMLKIMDSILKAVLKDGMKQVAEVLKGKDLDMAQLLAAGADSAGRKFLAETMKNDLAAEGTARMMGYGATATLANGQLRPSLVMYIKSDYVAPTVDAAFNLFELLKIMNSLQGQIDQSNALREGIKNFEQNVLNPRELQLEVAKQDLALDKAACDQWRKDNPGKEVRR